MDPRAAIRSFIEETFFAADFSDEDSFLGTGIIDSLGMLQLVGFLEEQFGVPLADEELVPENLDSVSRAAAFVAGKLQRRTG